MANNWAIAIGINQYQFFQPLVCAQADAQALRDFLVTKGRFSPQQCVVMSDTSPPIGDRSTQPRRENILLLLEDLAAACWRPGDRVWFFFSGYGVNANGRDYLMPLDGNHKRIQETGIEVLGLMQCLQAARVQALFLLDINRAMGTYPDAFVGQETIELAQELQLSTILSCQPEQFSYETTELGHGFFTAALLEALRSGNGNTLGELEAYLSVRTPQMCQHYWRPTQNPVTVMAYAKQKILGEINCDTDLDAAAIVLPEELFSAAVAAPRLEPTPKPPSPENQLPSVVTPTPSWGHTNLEPSVSSPQIPEPPSIPPSLPPASSASVAASALAKPPQRRPLSTLWMHLLVWSAGAAFLTGLILFLFIRHRNLAPQENTSVTSLSQTIPNFQPVPKLSSTPSKPFPSFSPTPPTPSKPQTSTSKNALATPLSVDDEPLPTPSEKPLTATSPSPNPSPSSSPNPSPKTSKPTPSTRQSPEQNRELARTELAKLGLKPNRPLDLNSAVSIASKIKPDNPNYLRAQTNMQIWNQMLLEIAKNRAQKHQYTNAIAAAKLITPQEPMYSEAKASIDKWQKDAKLLFGNKTVVEAAQKLIQPGHASTYNRAIEVAKRVPKNEPGAGMAKYAIDKWSRQILKLAQARAAKGRLKAAIETATLVPEDTTARKQAQKSIQTWKGKQK